MSDRCPPDPRQEGRAVVEMLGGHWTARGGMCRCPAHDDRSPSLSIRAGRRRLLLHCFAGCSAVEILDALQRNRLLTPDAGVAVGHSPVADGQPPLAEFAKHIWRDARIIAGSTAETYLRRRGIETNSSELRYHPRTPHGPKPVTQYRPALIAAVRNETGLVGIHRTFLDPRTGGLARLSEPKLGLGRFGFGAVRFGGTAIRLGLAEGLETALSASALFGIPCWAALGTERFRHVVLPAGVEHLMLFLDNDAGGRRAERLARETYKHVRSIEAHYPRVRGYDWNDVLRRRLGLPAA